MSGSKGRSGGAWLALIGVGLMLLSCGASGGQGDVPACSPAVGRVVSRQGSVEIRRAGLAEWFRVERLDTAICDGDAVRTGPRSRAALWLQPENLIRLDQKTAVSLVATKTETRVEFFANGQVSADPDCGAAYFISRFPRNFKVRTPFIAAAIKGTEFLVNSLCSSTTLAVFEGAVAAQDLLTRREIQVDALQQISVGPGLPSSIPIPIKPRDGVQWTIYYPRTASRTDAIGPLAPDQCDSVSSPNRCETPTIERLLAAGAYAEAMARIERLRSEQGSSASVLALEAVVHIARDQRDAALASAEQAVFLDGDDSSAWAALSYARQAKLDLKGALVAANRAAALDSGALSLARVAEVLLSMGSIEDASRVADQAVARDAYEPRALTVRGFARMARNEARLAIADFDQAVDIDSTDPLARVGLGLATIRSGNLQVGREHLEIASALDPSNSLIRSYLGKVYATESPTSRGPLAEAQLALARDLDPQDPTPSLYRALILQALNRPVEALAEADTSVRLNGNRAVYRSRLLLDQDNATRSASLARVYRDLGFEDQALTYSAKALSLDPLSYSAHAFLADYLTFQPRHEMARDSELLQAQLLQPLSLTPVQPRLAGNGTAFFDYAPVLSTSMQETTGLLAGDGTSLSLSGLAGERQTGAGSAVLSGLSGKVSYSLGGFASTTAGFRDNNDETRKVGNAFLQVAPRADTGVQMEYRHADLATGDTQMTFFDAANFNRFQRNDFRSDTTRVGGRYDFSADSTVIASLIHRELTNDFRLTDLGVRLRSAESATAAEVRHLYRGADWWMTTGIGSAWGDENSAFEFPGFPTAVTPSKVGFDSMYVYGAKRLGATLNLEGGLSYNRYRLAMDTRDKVNPKVGFIWTPTDLTTIRIAAFESVKRSVVTSQTIEPTTVAGFNQFYSGTNDINGASSRQVGGAILQRLNADLGIGGELTRRVVVLSPALGLGDDVDFIENVSKVYVHWSATRHIALAVAWEREDLRATKQVLTPNLLTAATTDRLPVTARYFHDSGLFATARAMFVHQEGDFVDLTSFSPAFLQGDSRFSIIDVGIGYRSADRRAAIAIEVRNLTDQRFSYQEINPQFSTVARERVLLLRGYMQF